MTDKWYIIQTRARWEKKIADSLEQKGIESYCPVKKVKRQWSDRMKTLEQPLFKSCVLVKITPEKKNDVRLLDGVINFVYENGKPVLVKEKEVQMLKKIVNINGIHPHDSEEQENGKQQKTVDIYLNDLSKRLNDCMGRPKLA